MRHLDPAPNSSTLRSPAPPPHDVDIILPANLPNSAAQMFHDLFRAANDLIPATTPYRVTVRSLALPVREDPQLWRRRTVIFLGDIQNRWQISTPQRGRLQCLVRLASRVVFVGGAVFLLGETGQQDAHGLAIHPNFAAAAAEEQLGSITGGRHFATSGAISSAISGFAALRLLLELINADHGQFISSALGQYLGLANAPEKSNSKVSLHLRQRACGDRLVVTALELMMDHIEEPKQIRELAQQAGVSTRKLERRFQDKTDTTPLAAYRMLRIERAHQLLVHTNLPLSEIVVATGFGSGTNLRHWFKKEYGASPQALRQRSFTGNTEAPLPA